MAAFAALTSAAVAQSASVLSSGTWAQFSVEKHGVYKIDFDLLKKAGINPDNIDPRKLQLFAYPTGMLPQSNAVARPADLQEVAVFVSGEEDGKFNAGDYLVFYGQGPDLIEYNTSKNIFRYQNNLYTDKNFYFLTVGQNGKRVAPTTDGTATDVVNEFLDFNYYETDSYNELKSGREWFGENFDTKSDITIRFTLEGITNNSEVTVVSSLMAQTYAESSYKLSWNNAQILDRKLQTVPETQYGLKGRVATDTLRLVANNVNAVGVTNQDIKFSYAKAANTRSAAYINFVLLQVKRKAAWYANPTLFALPARSTDFTSVEFSSAPSGVSIWDVSDPFACQQKQLGSNNQFVAPTSSTRNFAAFTVGDLPAPAFEQNIANQNVRGYSIPDLLIVTHPDFRSEAQRLANHRQSIYQIDASVVTTEEIYREFSGGRQDVSAIRDYIRFLYQRQPGKFKNVLLFGRGSYDYKKRVFNNTNYVPTYESRNSLSPLETYSSDDFFGFLEDNEGEWNESPAKNHSLDVGVGRLPVRTLAEAKDVVDKLIDYDTNPGRYAGWRQGILFVADDGDFNIHQSQADDLAEDIEDYGSFTTDKVYLDDFEQEDRASGQVSPQAAEALIKKIDKGFAIVNFTGHGSEQQWLQERILDANTPSLLSNGPKLPVFVTATCEFGRHDDPLLISTAELLLKKKKAGAIALVTTTRPVNSGTNFSLNKAFYSTFFSDAIAVKDLGTLFKETKNKSQSGVSNRNFSLLGDPSLRFGPSNEKVVVTSIKTKSDADTLKALSRVRVEGQIKINNQLSTDFNGTVEVALFDKRSLVKTKGDENPVFNYFRWDHTLFRGKASVVDGQFAIEMRLPVNLASEVGVGKMALYAFTDDKSREALGTATNFRVGLAEPDAEADNKGPSIQLFMGDTTFVDGGFANSDTRLIGLLSDKNGINISGYDASNLVATLDDEKTFVVNDYFVSDADDPTSGTFSYPISNLEPGEHRIRFSARDNYNNESVATVTFTVGKEGELLIEDLFNYPNPFSETTTIRFVHSRSGDDLQAKVLIYDVMGQLAATKEFEVSASTYKVDLFDWNGWSDNGTKMNPGVYLMRLSVRSMTDGAKNEKIAKLILLN